MPLLVGVVTIEHNKAVSI